MQILGVRELLFGNSDGAVELAAWGAAVTNLSLAQDGTVQFTYDVSISMRGKVAPDFKSIARAGLDAEVFV